MYMRLWANRRDTKCTTYLEIITYISREGREADLAIVDVENGVHVLHEDVAASETKSAGVKAEDEHGNIPDNPEALASGRGSNTANAVRTAGFCGAEAESVRRDIEALAAEFQADLGDRAARN